MDLFLTIILWAGIVAGCYYVCAVLFTVLAKIFDKQLDKLFDFTLFQLADYPKHEKSKLSEEQIILYFWWIFSILIPILLIIAFSNLYF